MDFENARQTLVGQALFLPTSPDIVYQYYSITLKANNSQEAQGKERVLLEWVGRWRRDTASHRAQHLPLFKSPLGISVHAGLQACQLVIPVPFHAAHLQQCRFPSVLPPGLYTPPGP